MAALPYRELDVYQRSHRLAMEVLDFAEASPALSRRYYYRDQMCDAAMSIPANIAEGNGRSTPLDYASFVDRSRGSLFELDSWLLGAVERGWLPASQHERLEDEIQQISAMLLALARRLRQKSFLESRSDGRWTRQAAPFSLLPSPFGD